MSHTTALKDKNIIELLTNFYERWKDKFGEQDGDILQILERIRYATYCEHRMEGLTHKQLMEMGLATDSYEKRYGCKH